MKIKKVMFERILPSTVVEFSSLAPEFEMRPRRNNRAAHLANILKVLSDLVKSNPFIAQRTKKYPHIVIIEWALNHAIINIDIPSYQELQKLYTYSKTI